MLTLAEWGTWASIGGFLVGVAALGVSIWVLARVKGISQRLILDVRLPSLVEPLQKAATQLKDAEFDKN